MAFGSGLAGAVLGKPTVVNTSQQWPRLVELFDQAIELEPSERSDFITEHCRHEPSLRRRLEELLAADGRGDDTPPGLEGDAAGAETIEVPGYSGLELVGRGGMGSVYRGSRQDRLFDGKKFAVKVMHAHRLDCPGRRRFELERRLLEALDHPNIVRLYEGGELPDQRPYLVMDDVNGLPLDVYCRQHRVPVTLRLELFAKLCDALQHAHQNRVVHRDLKPSNILVDAQGVPHLLDFGIAKYLDDRSPVTTNWVVPMTPRYASPEQARGQSVTTASDIYGAGLLLFELLTDQLPPSSAVRTEETVTPYPSSMLATAPPEVAWARSTTLYRLRRYIRGDLDQIAAKALRWSPEDRYASARELGDDVRRFLNDQPVLARHGGWRYLTGQFARRHRGALVIGGLAVLALSAAIAAGVQSRRLEIAASETLALVRAAADPDEEMLMEKGTLDAMVPTILALDQSREAKASLIVLLSRMSVPDSKLLAQAAEMFESWAREGRAGGKETELALQVGELLFHGGRFEHSERVLAAAVRLAEQSFGDESAELPTYLESHARVLSDLERFDQGIEVLGRSIRLRGRSGDQAGLARAHMTESSLYYLQGRFPEAVTAGRRALRALEPFGEALKQERASALTGLAVAIVELDPSDAEGEAEALARRALEVDIDLYGPGHMETIHARHNLTMVLGLKGQLEEAEQLTRSNIALAEKSLGPDHPRLAYLLAGLASGHRVNGKPQECIEVGRRAVQIRERSLGRGNWLTAVSQMDLATCLAQVGDSSEAIELLRAAIQTFEASPVEGPRFLARAQALLSPLTTESPVGH